MPRNRRDFRLTRRGLLLLCFALALTIFCSPWASFPSSIHIRSTAGIDLGSFEIVPVSGFVNKNVAQGNGCANLHMKEQQLAAANVVELGDDLVGIALSTAHPMVDYAGELRDLPIEGKVKRSWNRMAGSAVWLENYGVYLLVSRVYYYVRDVKAWSAISFIRAQMYDENWNHLDGYKLDWQGTIITFPYTFDIEAPYKLGGVWYGPEDPRIAVQPGLTDPEPIIIFNMIDNVVDNNRAMYLYRPFSNITTKLVIENQEPGHEKNWSPFFVPEASVLACIHGDLQQQQPTRYIHFVYKWSPFSVLRCEIRTGFCKFIYKYDQSSNNIYSREHDYGFIEGDIRGGTNFIPVPFSTLHGYTSFVGLPRSHVENVCGKDAIYRPLLVLLTTNGTHFFLDYTSEPLDFKHSIINQTQYDDHCGEGRIVIANGIARYDSRIDKDVMTTTFTVADSTVQVVELYGVRELLANLPQVRSPGSAFRQQKNIPSKINATHDLLKCASRSSAEFAFKYGAAERAERLAAGKLTENEKEFGIRNASQF